MRKTKTQNTELNDRSICTTREKLPKMLGCGQSTADRIAREAGARVKVGKRVLIKVDKLNAYLDQIAE